MTVRAGPYERTVAYKTKKSTKSQTSSVEQVVKDFNRAWEYTSSSYHTIWENAFSLYNNRRIKKAYKGITDTFVPMSFATIETMVAALFGAKPKFEFIPPNDKPDQNTDVLNALLNYFWDKDKWDIKVIKWGRGMLREGTSVIYLYWDTDHPCMLNVPLRDFFVNPEATDLQTARYAGRRYLTTVEELKGYEIVDPETGEMRPKYKNLDQVVPAGNSHGEQTDKEKKDIFYGSTVENAQQEQVEVIEYWTKDKVISIANRKVEIENSENYFMTKARANGAEYPQGLYPFAILRNYTEESLFYAKGELEVIADEQELLNDLTNQNQDSIIYSLNQMYTLDPAYSHLLNEIENIPGAVYLAKPDALRPIEQRPIPSDAFNERINLKNEIRETTASNETVRGVGQEQKTTATEVRAQIAGSGQRLALKVTQIENEGFHELAKLVFEMIKRYVNEPMLVRVVGRNGIDWENFDPMDFQGDYEPRVQLDTSVQSQKQDEAMIAKEMLGAFLNDPEINQIELKKMVLRKAFDLDPDEVDSLVQPPEMMGMEGMEGMPMEGMEGMEQGMGDVNVVPDPMTGELVPSLPEGTMPTDEELALLEAGL